MCIPLLIGQRVRMDTNHGRRGGVVTALHHHFAHHGGEIEVRWDELAFNAPALSSRVSSDHLALEIVHVLHHGLPLCGFSRDLPAQWPDGHVWTRLGSADEVSCKSCAAQARELVSDAS